MEKLPQLAPRDDDGSPKTDLTITPDIQELMGSDPPPSMEIETPEDIFVREERSVSFTPKIVPKEEPEMDAPKPKPKKVDRRRRENLSEAKLREMADRMRLTREKVKLKKEKAELERQKKERAKPVLKDAKPDPSDFDMWIDNYDKFSKMKRIVEREMVKPEPEPEPQPARTEPVLDPCPEKHQYSAYF